MPSETRLPNFIRVLIFALGFIFLNACSEQTAQTVTLQGETMGTTYTVKYLSNNRDKLPSPAEIQKRIDDALKEVNRQMSTYQPDSEISRFNQHTAGKPLRISSDFAHVTAEAVRLNRLTHGALDVTVGPLVNLWGFGPDKSVTREPSPEQIKQAASYTGIDKIILKQGKDYASLSKTHPKAYLDLSSIAKGFGVDKVAGELEKYGIQNYLVEIGGELHGKGKNARGEPWRIGIEQPNIIQGGNTQIIVPLNNRSLATSGDYRIFHVDKSGKRLSHIINPNNKRPISHNLASISVVADSAMTADGLSTGLFVLGETEALKLAEREKLAVFLIVRDKGGYRTAMSSEFEKLLR
ncbi:FAD:protein FMN transferase [Neisseria meningitidis]|uniref:FAD:protein FMN transferase n=1 Tax=Neisseria meningitidis TaxID=487 RepID=UPI000C325A71|nr:FAD:protein FMN transferase [Neisseria meningitidis]MBH2012656.1 FAD:protein FMN transferase [Neisseria meningitidis]MBH2014505.1 FAD:protein FMN transferase [Neisseria meningitidis]MBH2021861.1 FAD:protein FMN transferase [Neisseria meningitidis]MBH2026576.1 FAD:protein FMN transferase [Neisseria meningitidis]MBH2028497.1 FAD:protein FMN transferase [Neisseria meningitidis]